MTQWSRVGVSALCLAKCLAFVCLVCVCAEASLSSSQVMEKSAEINCLAVKKWLLGWDSGGSRVAPNACLKCHLSLMIPFSWSEATGSGITIGAMTTTSLLATGAFNAANAYLCCLVFSACECKNSTRIYCSAVQDSACSAECLCILCYRLVVDCSTRALATELPVGANQ